jgi:hypothetical protein
MIKLDLIESSEERSVELALVKEQFTRAGEKIALVEKLFYLFSSVGALIMGFGFAMWQKYIQPMDDRIKILEIKKLEQEVEAFNKKRNEMDGSIEPPIR